MMLVPIRYNIRNLLQRKGLTVMTALGVALTVTTVVFLMSLVAGLHRAFVASGDPQNVLVMRRGARTEIEGVFDRQAVDMLKNLPGVAATAGGTPAVSGETVDVIVLPRRDGTGEANVIMRGTSLTGVELRPAARLVSGMWFRPGQRELVVGRFVQGRFARTDTGTKLEVGKGWWTVVGVFDAGGTAYDSEIWGDVNQVCRDFGYSGKNVSSAYLRATGLPEANALKERISKDQRFELDAMLESDYYAEQTKSGAPIKFVGLMIAVIMAIGSCFAAMNTMYTAVAHRKREVATLRILGFTRAGILTSFLLESVLIVLLGSFVGVLLMLPFNGRTTGTSNAATFSEIVFSLRVTSAVVAAAVSIGLVLGLIGGLAPAWRAARQDIVVALRD
jgi:putative ABC transport system permease protein